MKPRPLNTKSDLIPLLRLVSPTNACTRAINEGRVTVLGGFTPTEDFPQYLARVTSERGKEWIIGIRIDEVGRRFRPVYYAPDAIPWQTWDGEVGRPSLKNGDKPSDSYREAQGER